MRLTCLIIWLGAGIVGRGMDIQWTRMAGQWPVEASPVVTTAATGGPANILVLNRGGQLLLWAPDGTAIGSGQDGLVAQLPEGRWTTAPSWMAGAGGAVWLVTSVEGLVMALGEKFQPVWQHKLTGETPWGRSTSERLDTGAGAVYVLGDASGTVTCLSGAGKVVWTNALGAGPIKVPPRRIAGKAGDAGVLVGAGSNLVRLDAAGQVRWRRDLGKEIRTQPEVVELPGRTLLLCGTITGSLDALTEQGEPVWECGTGDPLNNSIVTLTRSNALPLILCPGQWGNLHAISVEGRRVWTHLFHSKTRGTPVVVDAAGDGHRQILVPTFHQHVYAFDENGRLEDDVRLSGIMPSALTPIVDPATGRKDVLVTTTTLLAYRLVLGMPRSPYGKTGQPEGVSLHLVAPGEASDGAAVQVQNPHGALVNVEVAMNGTNEGMQLMGRLTASSAFEMALPSRVRTGAWSVRAVARAADARVLEEKVWQLPVSGSHPAAPTLEGGLRAWATEPYGAFSETRVTPFVWEGNGASQASAGGAGGVDDPRDLSLLTLAVTNDHRASEVKAPNLYLDEVGQGAFILASTRSEAVRMRVAVTNLLGKGGAAFGGTITLLEVVPTGTVNGELAADALPPLGDAGLVTIPAHRSVKIWVSVDTRGAAPGNYRGRIEVVPMRRETTKLELPLAIDVLSLRLPKEPSLVLCTWDYVPNHWFSGRSQEVLEDMSRHGVCVFPRSTIPSGRADGQGHLTIDWGVLDAELERLHGRGKILFHLGHPPIEFAEKKSNAENRPTELAYIREFRDHLRSKGWDYADYAFYLLDEPGLDYGGNIPVLLDAGGLFREADPKLRTYTDPVPGLSWKDFERIEPVVDIWAPNMRLVSGLLSGDPRMKRIMQSQSVWSYECVSQVKSLSPLRYNRANAWRAKFFGLGGIGFWTHSTTDVDHWFAGKGVNDEYALVYPGELPVPSVRWEAVRDGLADVAAITMLEQQIQRHRAAGTKSELVQHAEEEVRIALCDVMELSDEAFVESRDFRAQGDRMLWHTWTDEGMYRRHRAEVARLTLALARE